MRARAPPISTVLPCADRGAALAPASPLKKESGEAAGGIDFRGGARRQSHRHGCAVPPPFDKGGRRCGGTWGEVHPPGVVGQILICCPFLTQRAAEDCAGIFLGAEREKIPCKAQGVRCKERGSPQTLSGSPSPSWGRPLRGTRAATHARCQSRSAPSARGSKPLHSERTAGSPTVWDHLPSFLRSEA